MKVDKRFAGMFNEKKFQSGTSVDRYGRKGARKKDAAGKSMQQRMYELEPEEGDDDEEVVAKPAAGNQKRRALAAAAGAEDGDESDTSEATTEASDSDDEQAESAEGSAIAMWTQQMAAAPRNKEGSARLAVVNLDWEQVGAADILAVLRSFLPAGGSIRSVAIYLSDFGEEQLRAEAVQGPSGIWNAPTADLDSDDEDDARLGRDGGAVSNEKLRSYELSRYRFYHAVVVCDSVGTAEHLCAQREPNLQSPARAPR